MKLTKVKELLSKVEKCNAKEKLFYSIVHFTVSIMPARRGSYCDEHKIFTFCLNTFYICWGCKYLKDFITENDL